MIGRKLAQYSFINANVFSAMQSRLANRSSEALAEEERQDKANGLTNIAALMRANNVRVSDRIENTHDSVAVIFNDPKTDERVTLNLSKENLERLKGQFGKDNFYARSDGAIRLNGKAEAFVSGWFGDVAYQQNLAGADKDGSGYVGGEEWREVKTFLVNGVLDATSLVETSLKTYIPLGNYAGTHSFQTIEDGLNTFIEMDKDFDGHIRRIGELYEDGTRELVAETDKIIDEQERNALAKLTPNIFDNGNPLDANKPMTNKEWKKKLEKLKEMQEELDEQFAEMTERLKEQLQENGVVDVALENRAIEPKMLGNDSALNQKTQPRINKADDSMIDLERLAPVVAEIASKVASNDVQLFEVKI
ncbi:MAG: hypothetical protein K2N20_02135 [Helicobacter sp.]|nr:hypothetical protein [Helicobacter sp.]